MMFEYEKIEKYFPSKDGGRIARTSREFIDRVLYGIEEPKQRVAPEPYTAIVIKDGEAVKRTFHDEDTHLVFCEENPERSFILQVKLDEDGDVIVDGDGEPLDAEYIFGNPKVMAEMTKLGFEPEYETAENAEHFYNLAHPSEETDSNVSYI